jgi:hypothetical protein
MLNCSFFRDVIDSKMSSIARCDYQGLVLNTNVVQRIEMKNLAEHSH